MISILSFCEMSRGWGFSRSARGAANFFRPPRFGLRLNIDDFSLSRAIPPGGFSEPVAEPYLPTVLVRGTPRPVQAEIGQRSEHSARRIVVVLDCHSVQRARCGSEWAVAVDFDHWSLKT